MRNVIASLVAALVLVAVPAGAAEEGHGAEQPAKPHDRAWVQNKIKTCAACHGEHGVSQTASFPIIAGQYQDYLVHALKAYRDGGRQNAIMAGQVQGMTDDQIEALARYYARQESPLHIPALDP